MAALKALTSEVLIIGAGPAGLATATALSRLLITTTVFDSGDYRNYLARHMHNYPGFDHVAPADFRAASRKELTTRYHTNKFVDRKVDKLKKRDDGLFEAQDVQGETYVAKKVVLATGVKDVFLDIPGYEQCWGKTLFHCLFCHGYEERGSRKAGILADGVLANAQFAVPFVGMAKRLADEVVVFTNGNEQGKIALADVANLNARIDTRQINRVENLDGKDGKRIAVYFNDGEKEELGFVTHVPKTELNLPTAWIKELSLKLTEQGNLEVTQPFGETTCPGIFAAGDTSNVMKAVPPAISSGIMTAGGVAHQIVLGK